MVGRKIQEKSVNGVGEKSEIDEKTVTAAVEEDAEGIVNPPQTVKSLVSKKEKLRSPLGRRSLSFLKRSKRIL